MPTLETIRDEVFALLKGETKDLWDGEEDTEFLKEVGTDIAKLRFVRLGLTTDSEKESFKAELAIAEESLAQKVQQKKNKLNKKGQDLLPMILGVILKTLVSVV